MDWSNYLERKYYDKSELKEFISVYEYFFWTQKIKNFRNFNVLEIGSGHGINTLLYSYLFKNILATEPNDKLYEKLEEKINSMNLSSKIKTTKSSFEDLKSDKKFDMVILANVFLFINDKQKALLKLSKLIKKDKYLLIVEPIKFFSINDTKQNLVQDSITSIFKTNKFNILYVGLIDKFKWTYLLKLK